MSDLNQTNSIEEGINVKHKNYEIKQLMEKVNSTYL